MSKKKENMIYDEEKNQLTKTDPMKSIIELVDKDVKIAIINTLYMFQKVEENMSRLRKGMKEVFLKDQIKL